MNYVRTLIALCTGVITMSVISGEATAGEPLPPKPIVIAHRGASGYVPEHTLTAYFIAVQPGADYIEPDLVMTKDGILVARHENEISGTTDVAAHAEFSARKTTKTIDGQKVTGWFTEDFTLAELKTLRTRERLPQLRPANTRFDGQFEIPTFDEILSLVRSLERMRGAEKSRIGIYPETKHPSYFRSIELPLEGALLRTLKRWGYRGADAPVFIQSFEVGNLQALRKKTQLPIVQLMEGSGAPPDFTLRGDTRKYADLVTPEGLKNIAQYANAIGVEKSMLIPRDTNEALGQPTTLVRDAHAAGLKVHAWTMRAENYFLARNFRDGDDPASHGDLKAEVTRFIALGVDGFFTDHPALGVQGRDASDGKKTQPNTQ
ncbi:MAG: glycerophosphodiester phosphodiesterase [Candidatus Obscuribacterales bacterium]|nr:glycerophosphodiester phosphodiesterase [Steroidobacteraceae bacterium]